MAAYFCLLNCDQLTPGYDDDGGGIASQCPHTKAGRQELSHTDNGERELPRHSNHQKTLKLQQQKNKKNKNSRGTFFSN